MLVSDRRYPVRDNVLSLTLITINPVTGCLVLHCLVTLVYFHSLNFFLQNPFFHSLELDKWQLKPFYSHLSP
ncbi:hypothetical protein VNO80_04542 [Phaseolus coccineus]|uniref:Uncharacterized protein n=1 Tax=Phaseolus coccineus TaxID=3886 RepID=A0AAN9NYX4_PHACN